MSHAKKVEPLSAADTLDDLDPIFALIEAHKRALSAWEDFFASHGADGDPKLEREEEKALAEITKTQPRTLAGAGALLAYVAMKEEAFLDERSNVHRVMLGVAQIPFR